MPGEYQSIKADVLKKLEDNLSEIQRRFGIETIGIFGSVSRGEDTADSDVDVLYKFSTEIIRLRQFMGLKEFLEELFGREVDMVGMNWIEPALRPYVENDMILLNGDTALA